MGSDQPKSFKKVTLFQVSNQKWKIYVFYLLLILQLILIGASIIADTQVEDVFSTRLGARPEAISLITTIYGICIFIPWATFSLRCPKCRKAMIWYIMKEKDQSDFATHYVHIIHVGCPVCKLKYSSLLKSNDA